MNTDGDIECTCEVGIFATCPACEAQRSRDIERMLKRDTRTAEKPKPKAPHVVDLMLHYQKLAKERKN